MSTNSGAKIKICGIFRDVDIDYVNQYKPDYTGFVFWDKSHRYVTRDKAFSLKQRLCEDIKAVGVFVDESPQVIIQLVCDKIIDVVQLHGNESESDIRLIKNETGCQVIKAVKIKTGQEIWAHRNTNADYLLLDSGMGTGKPFDWGKADTRPGKPFFLAGGLGEHNLKEAIDIFAPYAVDLSSSVETDKVKDPDKIKRVIDIVRGI